MDTFNNKNLFLGKITRGPYFGLWDPVRTAMDELNADLSTYIPDLRAVELLRLDDAGPEPLRNFRSGHLDGEAEAENRAIMFLDVYSDLPYSSVGMLLLDSVVLEPSAELLALLVEHTAFRAGYQLGA